MQSQLPKPSVFTPRCDGQKGIALLASLFVLMVLTLLGLGLMLASSTEVMIDQNYRESRAAFYASVAGTEEARIRLGLSIDPEGTPIATRLNDANASTTGVYIVANNSINPADTSSKYYDSELGSITRRNSSGTQSTISSTITTTYRDYITLQGSTNQVPFAWVKITRKTENLAGQNFNVDNSDTNNNSPVYFGSNPANANVLVSQYVNDASHGAYTGNPVYLVTSMSLDSSGSQHKVQTEISALPPEPVTAAVDSYNQVTFHGRLTVSGMNATGCGDTTTGVAGVRSHGTIDSPNGSETVLGIPPESPSVNPWGHDVPNLIQRLRATGKFNDINSTGTNVTCSGGACDGTNVNLGTAADMKYYYSPGNLDIRSNGSHGGGILLVNGDITFHGGFSFTGLIICNGTINFTGGGSDTINITGAVIAGQSIDDTSTDLGGSINIQYNKCSITQAYQSMPMITLSFKDRSLY